MDWQMTSIQTPVCEGSVLTVTGNGKQYILYSGPAGSDRSNENIWVSADNGQTWTSTYRVSTGPGLGYSDLVQIDATPSECSGGRRRRLGGPTR